MFNFDANLHRFLQIVVCISCVIYIVQGLLRWLSKVRQLPPGPWGLPIVGYLPFLKQPIFTTFDQLAKTYGPVFSLKLGIHNVIVITDWDHMKQAFADPSLLARPHETFFPGLLNNARSLIEMSGDPWYEQRKTAMSILRTVGFGKSVMEDLILTEIDQFLTSIEKMSLKSFDFEDKIMPSVSNNIAILLFGHTFDYDDPIKLKLDEDYNDVVKNFQFAALTTFLPWLSGVLVAMGKFNVIAKAIRSSTSFFQSEVDKHEEKYNENEIVDYVDGYLLEMKRRRKESTKVEDDTFNFEVLLRNVSDFFGAGTETVTSTLTWAVLYLVKYPEIQDKIRSEIGEYIGFERKPTFSDKSNMPYTMAFIYETHRHASVLAANLLRRASTDTKVGNFKIPAESIVIFNFWSVHYDSKLWTDPEEFNPDRFLTTTDGIVKVNKPVFLVSFSGGKRACPGETLANVELFLYITCMLQLYKISVKPGTKISYESDYALSRRPKNMPKVIFDKIEY